MEVSDSNSSPAKGVGEQIDYLIVDDDEALSLRLVRALTKRGSSAVHASSFSQVPLLCGDLQPARIILDLRLKGEFGLDLLIDLKTRYPNTPILILTGYGSVDSAVQAMKLGAVNFIKKPADLDEILGAFEELPPVGLIAKPRTFPSLEEVEWDHIQRVLNEQGGNITKAAKLLGLHRRSLQRKLQKI